ncbi:MAG: S8 family serine peptidase [Thermoleophilia bacterium]|nr:S8 family serine peptidase [Thermoleophilia bacterium]
MTISSRALAPVPVPVPMNATAAKVHGARPAGSAHQQVKPVVTPAPGADTNFFASSDDALLVKLGARPDGTAIEAMPRGAERKEAAWTALQKTAASSQTPFVVIAEQLKSSGAIDGYQQLVSPNMLIIDPASGHANAVIKAFGTEGVAAIYANHGGEQQWPAVPSKPGLVGPVVPAWGYDDAGEPSPTISAPPAKGPTPGLELLGAPAAWKAGADGHGLVYGSIDSGVKWDHPALRDNFRGVGADGKVTQNYSWIDFLSKNGSAEAHDAREHGTHTIGSVVAHTADAQLGVAPGAKFISAAATGSGRIDPALRALQWMQAPTKTDGTAPRADQAPDVVGMSWFMGNPTQELFRDSIRNLRLAGVEVVKSAGNNGPNGGTITSPGQFPEVITAAAVNDRGEIADFSSRGPSPFKVDGKNVSKPDFAAPGVHVLSTVPTGYDFMDGTSMAQPHLSGVILDVLSQFPQLNHDQLIQVLASSAIDKGAPGRDAVYGNGLVNLPAALAAAAKAVGELTPKPPKSAAAAA